MNERPGIFQRAKARILHRLLDWLEGAGTSPPFAAAPGIGPAPGGTPVGIGIVGCGFVADFYAANLPAWPTLSLKAVYDRDGERARGFAARNGVRAADDLHALLSDPQVAIVVNLTNPASHADVTRAALMAGKHVYSEKPLALDVAEAEALVELARERSLLLGCAPCTMLGATAKALQAAVQRGDIGTVRLVYAELDDGPVHRMQPQEWASPQGTPWPWRDELATGCTLEHAGYHLSWMAMMFGPVAEVSGFSGVADPDKSLGDVPPGADFSVGCIRFETGVIARLTCSTIAPHDHRFRIIGDKGELWTDACWHDRAPIRLRRHDALGLRAETLPFIRRHGLLRWLFGLDGKVSDLSPHAGWRDLIGRHRIDYAAGIADLARAMDEGGEPALSGERALDVTRAMLTIDRGGK